MELTHQPAGEWLEVQVRGRLDGYWSEHFSTALETFVRQGSHRIRLQLAEVTFLSSAGIRVLMRFYKQLKGIQGTLGVVNPSEPVKKVLELSGLTAFLIVSEIETAPAVKPSTTPLRVEKPGVTFDVFEIDAPARMTCRLVGDPELLRGGRFRAGDVSRMQFPETSVAVGLGALGSHFDECQARFGEFLAAAGSAAYLPTDGTNVPDYLVATGASVPDLEVCYALVCEGTFGRLARFEAVNDVGSIGLSELVAHGLELAGHDRAAFVLVAETTGLIGAALRRSPARGERQDEPFAYPGVRNWLSFTAERAYPRTLALVVGVAERSTTPGPTLRPLGRDAALAGHFHAAAFSYHPLPKGAIDLRSTVASLFEQQTLQGLLHLLPDHRAIVGGGESAFVRGACWIGPLERGDSF
jgi:anti-anti-sigma factor